MKRRAQKKEPTITQRVKAYLDAYPEADSPEVAAKLKLSLQQVYAAKCILNKPPKARSIQSVSMAQAPAPLLVPPFIITVAKDGSTTVWRPL